MGIQKAAEVAAEGTHVIQGIESNYEKVTGGAETKYYYAGASRVAMETGKRGKADDKGIAGAEASATAQARLKCGIQLARPRNLT